MKEYFVSVSKNPKKKYDVVSPEGKIIKFGDSDYEDYTIHKDKARKKAYLARHGVREDWEDLGKAGAWSRYLLWNKPTLIQSIRYMERKFGIKIIF